MKNILKYFSILLLITATHGYAGNLQNADFATGAAIVGAGGSLSQLLNDTKMWSTVLGEQISTGLTNGDIANKSFPFVMAQQATPANPAAGFDKCYVKVDNKFYCLSSAGVESLIGPSGGGGTVTNVTASAPLSSSGGATPDISLTGVVDIAHGGTNSGVALNNNRIIISSGGAIVEDAAITANKALASNASGIPVASAVTDTELGYLSGVTSAIQTQLNSKLFDTDGLYSLKNTADPTKLQKWNLTGQTTGTTTTLASLSSQNEVISVQPLVDATGNFIIQNGTSGQVFIGSNTSIGGSNSGIQYSDASTANRGQIKLHSYFNGASIAGVSTLTSRSGTVGVNNAVVAGQDYSKWTAQAGAATVGSAPISGTFAFKANTVNALTVTSDFHLALTNLAGTLGDRLYLGSEGALQLPFYTTGIAHFDGTGNITSSGVSLTSDVSGTLPVTNGGTGDTTLTLNGILFGNGVGAVGITAQGAVGTVLHGNGGVPSFSAVSLTTDVSGTLPITSGGTGQITATAAFDALSPLTTKGDLLTRNGANNIRFPVGTDGQVVVADSTQASGLRWTAGGLATGGVIKFSQNGGVSVTTDFDSPHRFAQAATLSTVSVAMYDTGSSGTTTFQLNQWRAGVIIATYTGSVASNSNAPYSAAVALSGTFNILTNDMISADVTAVASGSQNLSVEIDSGALAGPTGPTGPAGASAVPTISGTAGAPNLITAVGGISFAGAAYNNITYIAGSGGPVTVTANPQITACTLDGQVLKLIGKSAVNTVTIVDAPASVSLNGPWVAGLNSVLTLICDSNLVWVEESRR